MEKVIATVYYTAQRKYWIKDYKYEGKKGWQVMEGNTLINQFKTEEEAVKYTWTVINSQRGNIVI